MDSGHRHRCNLLYHLHALLRSGTLSALPWICRQSWREGARALPVCLSLHGMCRHPAHKACLVRADGVSPTRQLQHRSRFAVHSSDGAGVLDCSALPFCLRTCSRHPHAAEDTLLADPTCFWPAVSNVKG
ncbi:unnamed protein product [Symbiodinium pilosum]|uniref:Uncharacterized protein n=1 Tax=Symbiodinium pilosum TaxID=2952 RepID=A0A812L5N7_SYMPI|nr:unnamed protein product [Symbiodinium pilosum]